MKKLLLLSTIVLASATATLAQNATATKTAASAQTTTQPVAQEEGKMRVGAGLVYGTEAGIENGGIGINIGGEYFFTEQIAAAPSLTYFFKTEAEFSNGWGKYTSSARSFTINLDGRYYFAEKGGADFYGLAGLTFASSKVEMKDSEDKVYGEAKANKVGLNLGAGLIYPINEKLSFNGQLKYNTPMKQIELQAGVTFPLNIN
ncbi:outer membrane beta-barrel protein [Pontibacter vulgaris]|uniref:outer membrane beta-barrel protein n=1 Tax=Pontibacter vulgaris TaxID=2905679 RepID=UPI001FA7C7AC|nr:outer membrane beta-barrel protein [Pontibacter vulgaris]